VKSNAVLSFKDLRGAANKFFVSTSILQ